MKQNYLLSEVQYTIMINKKELNGKYVRYIDKDGKTRVNKVVKINGNTLTVVNANGEKSRIKDGTVHYYSIKRDDRGRCTQSIRVTVKILGRQFRKRGLEEIDWGRGA